LIDGLTLLLGIALAGIGGEVFVRGSIGLAAGLRIPPGIIGATVAAFATSSPEFAVGVNAAVAGAPEISVGDVLGSNVVNLALVMGVVLVLAPIRVERRDIRRDLPFTIAVPLLLGLLMWDGRLNRIDGAILIIVFAVWMGTTVMQALRERDLTAETLGERSPMKAAALTLIGLVILVVAGRLVVSAADGIGHTLQLDPFIVGATMVAFGTSVPELATSLLARLRGHGDMGAGTVMGSNIFNTLWIVGVVVLIGPFDMQLGDVRVAVIAGSAMALLMIPGPSWTLGRLRGALLIAGYALYIALLLQNAA